MQPEKFFLLSIALFVSSIVLVAVTPGVSRAPAQGT
jgi:hypothetical protein